jgi:hypothetical protein
VSRHEDDDDWARESPERGYTRDRPEFWRRRCPLARIGLVVIVVVLVLVAQ